MGDDARRRIGADAGRRGESRRHRDDVRRQRRRRPAGDDGRRRRAVRDAEGRGPGRSHDRVGDRRARGVCGGEGARNRISRCAGVRWAGGRREREADDHGRRRCRCVRESRRRAPALRARRHADGRGGRGAAHQDGQPDLHRRARPGTGRGNQFRDEGGPRRRARARRDQQGRRAVVADGEPRQDDGRRQVRLRLRRRLDAQGPLDLPGRVAQEWRATPGDGARRPVLCRRAEAGRQALGYVEPDHVLK